MGDMADYTIEIIERLEADGDGCDEEDEGRPSKTCRCCGRTGLQWGLHDDKWRLFDNRGIHVCKVNPLKSNVKARL